MGTKLSSRYLVWLFSMGLRSLRPEGLYYLIQYGSAHFDRFVDLRYFEIGDPKEKSFNLLLVTSESLTSYFLDTSA